MATRRRIAPGPGQVVQHCTPPLSTADPKALLHTYRTFAELIPLAVRQPSRVRAVFDLSQCDTIDPGAVLLMMHAAKALIGVGREVYFRGQLGAFDVMQAHLAHYRAPREERKALVHEPGAYPLRGVTGKDEMVTELQEWADRVQAVVAAPDEQMARWRTQIAEVTTNSFQHARETGRDVGDVLLAGDASTGGVQLAVLDRGAGIPTVLRPALPHLAQASDSAIIAEACKKGVTSRCTPYNQGQGLFNLVEAVKRAGGRLQILSGRGLAHVSGRVYARALPRDANLQGTLTIVTLRGIG